MRITALVFGLLISTPIVAQEVIIQTPNPAAAGQAARASNQASHDAYVEQNQARQDQGIANYDASHGYYGAARSAEDAARDASHDSHTDSQVARHDANVSHQDDTYRLQIVP